MNFVVAVKLQQQAFQLSLPDVAGVSATANTIEKGLDLLKQKLAEHFEILAEYGEQLPKVKTIDEHIKQQAEPSIIWLLLEFDIVPYLGKSHKINVTLPELLIRKIDDRVAKQPEYKTRSGFIAKACLALLEKLETKRHYD